MKKMRGFLGVIIAVLIMFPFAIVNAEDAAATAEYTVKFNLINGFNEDGDFDDQVANEANGFLVTNPGKPYTQKGIFVGWYTDKTYSTKFDFTKEIKADTTVYAKYVLKSDIEKKIKEKLDAANLTAVSTLTEKEALDYFKSYDEDLIEASITFDESKVPSSFDGITLLVDDWEVEDYYVSGRNGITIELSYRIKDDDNNNSTVYYMYYNLNITYSDTNNRDEGLNKQAEDIADKVDNKMVFEDYTELTDQQLHSEHDCFKSVKEEISGLDPNGNFNIDLVDENYRFDEKGQIYFYSTALVNGDNVYNYINGVSTYAFKITIDPSVANNHAAYLASIKEQLMDFLVNKKGYAAEDIEIDPEDMYEGVYHASRMIVRIGGRQGEVYSIYMIKDDDSILMAKNLMVNNHDYSNSDVYALSYSEDKEFLETYYENQLKGIEELKSTIENDGYDFFEGYSVFYYPEEGKSVKLTFTVGTENNNRRIKVLHKLDNGAVEKFEGIVKDGRFTIEITQGSPFAVGLGEVVKALKNNPQTFDPIVLTIMLLVVSALGACVSIKLLKD